MSFERALKFVLSQEGGYSDNANDPGGATNLGITQATLSKWRGRKVARDEVRALSVRQVSAIYRRNYWQACKCDHLPPALAFLMFDAAVNQGVGRAIKILQKSIDTKVDGIIGPQTLKAVNKRQPKRLMIEFAARRMRHYGVLSIFSVFGLGWSRRLMEALYLAFELNSEIQTGE